MIQWVDYMDKLMGGFLPWILVIDNHKSQVATGFLAHVEGRERCIPDW